MVSTAAALELLGPTFRYTTRLLGAEPDKTGTIRGDIYLLGTWDPTLSAADMNGMADQLKDAAQEALRSELALLDINLGLGQPSGIDAYNWLRERSYQGRIVFVTGHAFGHPLVDEARRIGGAAVLAKPVPFDQLTKLIREVAA